MMPAPLSSQEIKHLIMEELPRMVKTDPEIRTYVLNITKDRYADRDRTEDRIDRILDELKRDREENQRKWEENQRVIEQMLASIKSLEQRFESSIGALGARWGLHSEAAFRNGLKAILEHSFGVTVERYQDFDYEGIVFGRPDQIELDVLIYNGTIIVCELKSSLSTPQMYAFWRKRRFYEKKHDRTVDRALVISPMIEDHARKVAAELGIEVYSYADEVPVTP